MTANFILYRNYAIHFEDKYLDLHNNFDFEGFSYNVKQRALTLNWKGAEASWIPVDNPSQLTITISDVEFLRVTPRDSEVPFSEDTCLMDWTYYSSLERDEEDCVCDQEKPTENDDIIFKFQSGQTIRAKGSSLKVTVW